MLIKELWEKIFEKGGEVKYAIYEDYDGNDIKTEKFDKGRDEDDIVAPSGYEIADFDEDDDGVVYVRFQQEEEFAKGGKIYQVKDMDKFDKWFDETESLYGGFKKDEVRYEKDGVYISDDIYKESDSLNRDNLYAKGGKVLEILKDKSFSKYTPKRKWLVY